MITEVDLIFAVVVSFLLPTVIFLPLYLREKRKAEQRDERIGELKEKIEKLCTSLSTFVNFAQAVRCEVVSPLIEEIIAILAKEKKTYQPIKQVRGLALFTALFAPLLEDRVVQSLGLPSLLAFGDIGRDAELTARGEAGWSGLAGTAGITLDTEGMPNNVVATVSYAGLKNPPVVSIRCFTYTIWLCSI